MSSSGRKGRRARGSCRVAPGSRQPRAGGYRGSRLPPQEHSPPYRLAQHSWKNAGRWHQSDSGRCKGMGRDRVAGSEESVWCQENLSHGSITVTQRLDAPHTQLTERHSGKAVLESGSAELGALGDTAAAEIQAKSPGLLFCLMHVNPECGRILAPTPAPGQLFQ